jgi:hypothetical protein
MSNEVIEFRKNMQKFLHKSISMYSAYCGKNGHMNEKFSFVIDRYTVKNKVVKKKYGYFGKESLLTVRHNFNLIFKCRWKTDYFDSKVHISINEIIIFDTENLAYLRNLYDIIVLRVNSLELETI